MSVPSLALAPSLLYAAYSVYAVARTQLFVRRFPPSRQRADADWPRLSIIVPACNEATTLEAALKTKLAVDYPNFELVVVNDRSTDETGEIIDRVASTDARVRPVHVTSLPEGWLGKLHALERGRAAATGDLLLFSDADVSFSRDLLRRAVSVLLDEELDFVTLFPHVLSQGFFVDASITAFFRGLVVGGRVWRTRNPKVPTAVGSGVFNLVRRSVLEKSLGFSWIKMEVADDVAFGQMLKQGGARAAVFNGADDVTLAYYESFRAFVHGLEKNAYAGSGFRLPLALALVGGLVVLELSPIAMFAWLDPVGRALACLAVLLCVLSQALLVGWARRPLLSAVMPVLGPALVLYVSIRAIWITHRQGGIYWRGTFYPLAALRAGSRIVLG